MKNVFIKVWRCLISIWRWIVPIVISKEFIIAISIFLFTVYFAFPQFIEEQRFKVKVETYIKALEIVNQYILSQNILLGEGKIYEGDKCDSARLRQDENNAYTVISLIAEDPIIPQEYLKNILSSTTPAENRDNLLTTDNPIRRRENFINLLRKDLGFKEEINLQDINNGNSLIVNSNCIKNIAP